MAKKIEDVYSKKEVYEYPSHYGSHSSMIDETLTTALVDSKKWVVLKDEIGPYVTRRVNLDNGLADPYRFGLEDWRKELLNKRMIG
jgi:hypothetical protein